MQKSEKYSISLDTEEYTAEEAEEILKEGSEADADEVSIKKQIQSNVNQLNSMNVVASYNAKEVFEYKQQVVEWAMELYEKINYKVTRSGFGEIVLDKKRVKKGVSYTNTYAEKIAFALIPNVLEKGVEIGTHINHKQRLYDTFTFAAPVEINGMRGNMAVVVRQEGKNYYKAHRIVLPDGTQMILDEKRDTAETAGGVKNNSGLSPTDNVSTDIIPSSNKIVNKNSRYSISLDTEEYTAEEAEEILKEGSEADADEVSIKKQIQSNVNQLNSMNVVASYNAKEVFEYKQQVVEWAMELYKKINYKVTRSGFGEIVLDEKRIKKGVRYAKSEVEKIAFAVIPDVLKKGVEIGSHINHKQRLYDTYTFAAPVEINGMRGNMAVVVRQEGKNYYKAHRIVLPDGTQMILDEKRDTAERAGGVENNSGLSPTDNVSTDIIPSSNKIVNKNSRYSFSLDTEEYTAEEAEEILKEELEADADEDIMSIPEAMAELSKNEKAAFDMEAAEREMVADFVAERLLGGLRENGDFEQESYDALIELAEAPSRDSDMYRQVQEIRDCVRAVRLRAPDEKYNGDFGEGYESFRRKNQGRIWLSKSGDVSIDAFYDELNSEFGEEFFPSDINNVPDQLKRISEVVNLEATIDGFTAENVTEATEYIKNKLTESINEIFEKGQNDSFVKAEDDLAEQIFDAAVYNVTIDIAKSADGRTILYATKGKIKKVGNVQVNSIIKKGSGQNSNFKGRVPQNTTDVKENSPDIESHSVLVPFSEEHKAEKRRKYAQGLAEKYGGAVQTERLEGYLKEIAEATEDKDYTTAYKKVLAI